MEALARDYQFARIDDAEFRVVFVPEDVGVRNLPREKYPDSLCSDAVDFCRGEGLKGGVFGGVSDLSTRGHVLRSRDRHRVISYSLSDCTVDLTLDICD
jgi:hypothetical protein